MSDLMEIVREWEAKRKKGIRQFHCKLCDTHFDTGSGFARHQVYGCTPTVSTRWRNGRLELVPPVAGYKTHEGKPTTCENDWHDNHDPGSTCPECGDICRS